MYLEPTPAGRPEISPMSLIIVCHCGPRAGSATRSKTISGGAATLIVVARWLMFPPNKPARSDMRSRADRTSAGSSPHLETGIGAANFVGRLVVHRGAAGDVAVGEPEPRTMPRALDAAVDERPFRQRSACVGA